MSGPVLTEARPLDGGVELIYELGHDRASVRIEGRRIVFPHAHCASGESLGNGRDELVRRAAAQDLARCQAAAILAGGDRR